jgi:hypothetical protein
MNGVRHLSMEATVRLWKAILLLGLCLMAVPVFAQSSETNTVAPINYDDIVEDNITDAAFFDWWKVQVTEGDEVVIDMSAAGGLQPLIGLLDVGGDLIARSQDGAADDTVTLDFVVPSSGEYTIVATRVGNADGTSTGAYSLRLRLANPTVVEVNPYQDVTFRCEDYEVTTAATLAFQEDSSPGLVQRVTVYGINGFQPVIRLNTENPEPFELCNTDAEQAVGDVFTLPDGVEGTVTADNLTSVSQLIVRGADQAGFIKLTIGSKDGTSGRYVVVIEGFSIEPDNDSDAIEVRVGPLAAETTAIQMYMVAGENSRVDPFMTRPDTEETCDDAGRKGCEAVATFNGSGFTLHEGTGTTIIGDRSDAGLLINPGNPDPVVVTLNSRSGRTHGTYALVFIGELPPRPAS